GPISRSSCAGQHRWPPRRMGSPYPQLSRQRVTWTRARCGLATMLARARTADNDAAPRVIVPNHAITGSYPPAPLSPPPQPGPDHEPPMETSRSGNEQVKTLLPEGGERKERPIAKRHRKGLFDVAKRDANCLN